MTWHLEAETVASYQAGTSGRAASASVETHLASCPDCRQLVAEPEWMQRSWKGIEQLVDTHHRSWLERTLSKLGVGANTARLITATPSMTRAWLLATFFLLAFVALLGERTTDRLDLFLILVPAIPVIGVGLAYGRAGDRAYEMTVTAPFDAVRLLLLRTAVVTVTTLVVAAVVDAVTGFGAGFGLWLLPTLMLVTLTLALGTRVSIWSAAIASTSLWAALVLLSIYRPPPGIGQLFESSAQSMFLVELATSTVVFMRRRDHYRKGEL